MTEPGVSARGPLIEQRYGIRAAREWQLVRGHVALNEGFSLVLLLVPDQDGARLCRNALDEQLHEIGRGLLDLSPDTPVALRRIAETLLNAAPNEACGAIWLAAAVSAVAPDAGAWDLAWRWGLATLNQHRNPLRERFHIPLFIAGTPSLMPLFREVAPDLWSVRDLVVHIEPPPVVGARDARERGDIHRDERRVDEGPIPDLELALDGIRRLRGVTGRERELATLYERAGTAYRGRNDPVAAEACLRDAQEIRQRFDTPVARGITTQELGRAVRDQGRAAEAETLFRAALALAEEGGDTPVSRGLTTHELGVAVRGQGRAAEAETLFRAALALKDEGGATPVSRGITMDELGRAVLDQGRAAEAETLFHAALALKEEGGDTPVSRGITTDMIGRAVLDQGRTVEAETLFRAALALAEEGGDDRLAEIIREDIASVTRPA